MEPSKDSQSNEIFGLPFLQYRPCRGQVCRICVSVNKEMRTEITMKTERQTRAGKRKMRM